MRYRCPSCGLKGIIRAPDYFSKVKKVGIKCARCGETFGLILGRLWPQDNPASYDSLLMETSGCRGTLIGSLWVEIKGTISNSHPLLVLQGHPAFPHELMHDLADFFADYTRVCYCEFPGTGRNRGGGTGRLAQDLCDTIALLKARLEAPRVHLLSHLYTCPLALKAAQTRPDDICTLTLIEPQLARKDNFTGDLIKAGYLKREERERLLYSLFTECRQVPLEDIHLRGLARIMAPGFSAPAFRDFVENPAPEMDYRQVSRLETPTIIFSSVDGGKNSRNDALFLNSSLPDSEFVELKKGGDWAAWLSGDKFKNRAKTFNFRSEKQKDRARSRRTETLSGQPVGLILLFFILLTWGLTILLEFLPYQPLYMRKIVPPLVGAILPVLWFLVPKKINLFSLFRFRAFTLRNTLLPLLIGALFGLAWYILLQAPVQASAGKILLAGLSQVKSLLTNLSEAGLLPARLVPVGPLLPGLQPEAPLSFAVPDILLSISASSEGRWLFLGSLIVQSVFVFGFLENMLMARRSRGKILLPVLVFTLTTLSLPDVAWRVPLGLISAFIFRKGLSIFSPLLLLLGFALSSELPLRYLEASLLSYPGLDPAGLSAFISPLILVIIGTTLSIWSAASGKSAGPESLYFYGTLSGKRFVWDKTIGMIIIMFSLVAAIIFMADFL